MLFVSELVAATQNLIPGDYHIGYEMVLMMRKRDGNQKQGCNEDLDLLMLKMQYVEIVVAS